MARPTEPRGNDGRVRHYYAGNAEVDADTWRGIDQLTPVSNVLDLTPEGRGDWSPSLRYESTFPTSGCRIGWSIVCGVDE